MRALAQHLVGVASAMPLTSTSPDWATRRPTAATRRDGLAKAFDEARQEAFAAWSDDAVLGEELVLPWATLPGAVVAGVYTLELTAHAWDLASVTGQLDALDPALADVALSVAEKVLPPEPRGGGSPARMPVPFVPATRNMGDVHVAARRRFLDPRPTRAQRGHRRLSG